MSPIPAPASLAPVSRHRGPATDSGLYYYAYRYYDPVTGRWPSRDPIEELGGVNVYGFLFNEAVNSIEMLGLARYEYDNDGFHVHATCEGRKLTYAVEFNDDGSPAFRAKNGHDNEFDLTKAKKHWERATSCEGELQKMRDRVKEAYERLNENERVARQGRNLRRLAGAAKQAARYVPVLMFFAISGLAEGAQGDFAKFVEAVEKRNTEQIPNMAKKIADQIPDSSLRLIFYNNLIEAAENYPNTGKGSTCCDDADCGEDDNTQSQ